MLKRGLKSGVAVVMALGLSTSGILVPWVGFEQPAVAGLFSQSSSVSVQVPAGTTIQASEKDGKKIIITPEETVTATLAVTEPVRSSMGTILIPKGAKIEGQFQPVQNGTQFVAKRIILADGTQRDLSAKTNIVTHRETIKKGRNWNAVWQGALVGGAAAALISSLISNVGVFKVLGGVGAGALGGFLLGGRKKAEVLVVEPNIDPLTLTLDASLVLNS